MTSPTPLTGDAVLSTSIDGATVVGTVTASVSCTVTPFEPVPDAVAVLAIEPASKSAWVAV